MALLVLLAGTAEAAPHRSAAVRRQFLRETGYPHGRIGFIVDHVIPLCAGGPDAVSNLQWQTRADSIAKDREERALCRSLRPATAQSSPRRGTSRPSPSRRRPSR